MISTMVHCHLLTCHATLVWSPWPTHPCSPMTKTKSKTHTNIPEQQQQQHPSASSVKTVSGHDDCVMMVSYGPQLLRDNPNLKGTAEPEQRPISQCPDAALDLAHVHPRARESPPTHPMYVDIDAMQAPYGPLNA